MRFLARTTRPRRLISLGSGEAVDPEEARSRFGVEGVEIWRMGREWREGEGERGFDESAERLVDVAAGWDELRRGRSGLRLERIPSSSAS